MSQPPNGAVQPNAFGQGQQPQTGFGQQPQQGFGQAYGGNAGAVAQGQPIPSMGQADPMGGGGVGGPTRSNPFGYYPGGAAAGYQGPDPSQILGGGHGLGWALSQNRAFMHGPFGGLGGSGGMPSTGPVGQPVPQPGSDMGRPAFGGPQPISIGQPWNIRY